MKITAYMQVGNENTLIDAVISHTLGLGVDSFLIVDAASTDGTAETLKTYADDSRFDIVFLEHDQIFGANPPDVRAFGQNMIKRIRDRFDPDWILRLDADEFWLCNGKTIKEICNATSADQISVPRFNAVRVPEQDSPESLIRDGRMDEVAVLAHPFPVVPVDQGQAPALPLNFTRVGHKPLLRANAVHAFSRGGHGGVSADGAGITSTQVPDLAILHLWFTRYDRFVGKTRFIEQIKNTIRRNGEGWQWTYWGRVAESGDPALQAEFDRQFPTPAQFAQLQTQGRVAMGRDLWRVLQETPAHMDADDLAALGWGD